MPAEKEIVLLQKATVYDIRRLLEKEPDRTCTLQELRQILDAYITSVEA
ncbi:hypothetical protein [Acutalibacter muris]|jgi:hypothetical protein|nr:hypothetical protein [Acutalibacter muris]MCI9192240.1 hypothetical protein [Acutalibacter muris]MCI9543506.1 hypothetical protein [Acutalibacter muris]